MTRLSLEDPAYVEKMKAKWPIPPKGMTVIEFYGDGDPFFGGTADDRPLGIGGSILDCGSIDPHAEFATIEDAHGAAKAIKNRRPGSILGVLPWWVDLR